MTYEIQPINTGYLFAGDAPFCNREPGPHSADHVPAVSFLVSKGTRRLLIDTGMPSTPVALEHRTSCFQPRGFDIVSRLYHLGLSLEQISAVIFTHLHWDHCAYAARFAGICKLVQREEAEFALDPPSAYRSSYRPAEAVLSDPATQRIEGQFEFDPHIFLFPTPGHTPGHQSVGIRTNSGLIIVAGDAAWPAKGGLSPPRKAVDEIAAGRSFQRVVRFDAPVLASHDPCALAC